MRRFRCLEEFALKTSADLVPFPGCYDFERRVILGWVFGARIRNSQNLRPPPISRSHPTLYHIVVLYGGMHDGPVLSKWFKYGQNWQRLGQPITGDDVNDVDF